jgi:uncharacterized protein YbcI
MNSDPQQTAGEPGEPRLAMLQKLSKEAAKLQRTAFGKGPETVKSYFIDDLLLIVMRDSLTIAEKTMLEFGQGDLVRQFRQTFENEMTKRFTDMVEDVTGRSVLTYQSQIMFHPDVVVEMFVFDRAIEGGFVAAEYAETTEHPRSEAARSAATGGASADDRLDLLLESGVPRGVPHSPPESVNRFRSFAPRPSKTGRAA